MVLRGMKESENLPLYSASRQELQQQQYQTATGRPVPFPTTTKAAQSSAALAAGIMKMTQSQQSMGLTISKVTVPKANIVNVGRAAAAAQPKGVAGLSGVTITPIGASTAGSSAGGGGRSPAAQAAAHSQDHGQGHPAALPGQPRPTFYHALWTTWPPARLGHSYFLLGHRLIMVAQEW